MSRATELVELVTLGIEILGLVLLAREVWNGQKSEKAEKKWAFARRMMFHYTMRDWPRLLVEGKLDEGASPEVARDWLHGFSATPGMLETEARRLYDPLMPVLAEKLKQWNFEVAEDRMRRRARDLWVGTFLLGLAAAVHVVSALRR